MHAVEICIMFTICMVLILHTRHLNTQLECSNIVVHDPGSGDQDLSGASPDEPISKVDLFQV